ncbi:hypothetical protein FDECE_4100 [Fusarium decemcellulare]|nr:hypothetical protein FDECE_4100 [Fusarium decemcellulare]
MTYPFIYTDDVDFEPIVAEMARLQVKEPYDWQSYAAIFDPHACKLFETASTAEQAGQLEKASEYYLRATNVWFISRYPALLCDVQQNAWERSKYACLKGLQLRGIPIREELIPHKHGLDNEGKHIPVWVTLPGDASKDNPAPIVLGMGGLDSWRPELASFAGVFRSCGIGMVIVEVPGTGDSPALVDDPLSPDRLWSSLLDWVDQNEAIDSKRVVGWGISTGGYYAIRAAYTHHSRLLGMVSHGGACHHAFDPEWLENIDQREFAHSASEAFAWKWGFEGNVERLIAEASDKFSLLKDGTLDKPDCTRFFRDKAHMGGKASYGTVVSWILEVLGISTDYRTAMSALDYKPKH